MTAHAVFQPRPGLGDLIWHLPLIRALATRGPITLITKPSTQADTLLANDALIGRIVWFDRNPRQGRGRHDGPLGFPRLVATLRAARLDSCVLLHHGASLAASMRLAGIPHRAGYGTSRAQRAWLNRGPYLGAIAPFTEAFDQATAYAAALGLAPLPEARVAVDPGSRERVLRRLEAAPRPWSVLGIGSQGANRQWGVANWAALAAHLARRPGSVILLAAGHEAALASAVIEASGAAIQAAAGWALPEAIALLAEADLFVGNDSGLMNLRAAVGRPAYGLFGASGPLRHSALIRPVIPPAGPRAGMAAITVPLVLDTLARDAPEQAR